MKNPWSDFAPEPSRLVHPDDERHVTAYNAVYGNSPYALRLGMWPHPWVGPLETARIVVLAANPGGSDEAERREATLATHQRENLSGTRPVFFLDDDVDESAAAWFRQRLLKDVLLALGGGPEADRRAAAGLAIADLHPYHSARWRAMPITLPTQRDTFELVRQRIADGAVIIILRAAAEWRISVPELWEHSLVFATKSPQQARLSRGNLGDECWNLILERL